MQLSCTALRIYEHITKAYTIFYLFFNLVKNAKKLRVQQRERGRRGPRHPSDLIWDFKVEIKLFKPRRICFVWSNSSWDIAFQVLPLRKKTIEMIMGAPIALLFFKPLCRKNYSREGCVLYDDI